MNKNITNIEAQIHNYNQSFQNGENFRPKSKCCPKCKEEVMELGLFKYHDQRRRHVKLIVQALVKIFFIILIRCKCPLCKKKFTLYPSFLLPNKHYAEPHIVELCKNYLEKEMRYEDAVKDENARISYDNTYRKEVLQDQDLLTKEDLEDFEKKESFMAATTIYRWLSWLGSLESKLTKMLDIIRQISPQATLFREITPLYSNKYQTEERKLKLETGMRILQIKDVVIMGRKFFPDFAIDY